MRLPWGRVKSAKLAKELVNSVFFERNFHPHPNPLPGRERGLNAYNLFSLFQFLNQLCVTLWLIVTQPMPRIYRHRVLLENYGLAEYSPLEEGSIERVVNHPIVLLRYWLTCGFSIQYSLESAFSGFHLRYSNVSDWRDMRHSRLSPMCRKPHYRKSSRFPARGGQSYYTLPWH